MSTTRLAQFIRAPRHLVYHAIVDVETSPQWLGTGASRRGTFSECVTDERVVELVELAGNATTITYVLRDVGNGTRLDVVHDGLPAGVSPADAEAAWRAALDRLARLVESDPLR